MKSYYVYIHRKATTGEVFYVGKGTGRRAREKCLRSAYWKRVAKKHGVVIEILIDGVQEWYALEYEQLLIDYYGRRDLGTGQLVNLCDGGAASTTLNDEAKQRIRQSRVGKKASVVTRQRLSQSLKGRTFSPEHLEKLRIAGKKRGFSDKAKSNLVAKLSKPIERSDGLTFNSAREAARFIRSEGLYVKAMHSNISAAALGKVPKAYGFSWRYL
jgi:hypothetical protein